MTRLMASYFAVLVALIAIPAAAHLTPNSEIRLRFEPGVLRIEVLIAEAQYHFATGRPVNDLVGLRRYIPGHTLAAVSDEWHWSVGRQVCTGRRGLAGPL